MVEAIKQNFPQREIADAAFRYQQEVDSRQRIVVGVNDYVTRTTRRSRPCDRPGAGAQAGGPPGRRPGPTRDAAAVERTLGELKAAAATEANLMPLSSTAPAPAPPRARWSPPCRRSSAATPSRRSSELQATPRAVWTRRSATTSPTGVRSEPAANMRPSVPAAGLGAGELAGGVAVEASGDQRARRASGLCKNVVQGCLLAFPCPVHMSLRGTFGQP